MKAGLVSVFALVLLRGFAGAAFGAAAPAELVGDQCGPEEVSLNGPELPEGFLDAVVQKAWTCSTVADCPCPTLCGCNTRVHRCLCLLECCPQGQCP